MLYGDALLVVVATDTDALLSVAQSILHHDWERRERTVMKKLIVQVSSVLLCVILACGAMGCSKNVEPIEQSEPATANVASKETDEPQDLEIVESGYWFDEYNDDNYAVIIQNGNMNWAAENVQVKVTGKDDAGQIVGSDTNKLSLIFPNGKTALCGETLFEGASTLEFQLINSKKMWTEIDIQQAQLDQLFFVDAINETTNSFGDTTVSGQATNQMDAEIALSTANAVFRDEAGNVLGGAYTYLDTMTPDSTLPFSITSIDGVPSHAKVEIYLNCGSLIS